MNKEVIKCFVIRYYLVLMIILNIFLTVFRCWNIPLGVDDAHSLLESIGQIALQPTSEVYIANEIQSDEIWRRNNLTNVLKCTNNVDNGNMLIFHNFGLLRRIYG